MERQKVDIAEVHKKGDWLTVVGHVDGQRTHCHINEESLKGRKRKDVEDLMKRSLAGTAMMERGES